MVLIFLLSDLPCFLIVFERNGFLDIFPIDFGSCTILILIFPGGHGSVSDLDDVGNVTNVDIKLVEGSDGFVLLAYDVVLALPVEADGLHVITGPLLILVFDHIYPHILENVHYAHPMIELELVATKCLYRNAARFGKGLNVVFKVLALLQLVVADDDKGHPLIDELDNHALHVGLGTSPR